MKTRALRGMVVGLGVMGGHHLRVLTAMEDVRVLAVVDPDNGRRAAAASAHAGLETFADVDAALGAEELDFACVATPHRHLVPAAAQVLAAGVHVLVEKPTADHEKHASELIRDAEERGLLLGVGHVERFNPAVIALKAKLDEGLVGRILQMHARRLSPFPNRATLLSAAVDLATHDIDVMRYITGSEVERVFAETTRIVEGHSDDLVCATLRFDSGATGLLEVNWVTPTKVRELSVIGEAGMLVVNYLTQELSFYEHPTRSNDWDVMSRLRGGGEGNMVRYALDRKEPLRVQWEAFLTAMRRGGPPPVTGTDGLASLSTATAIRRAGESHEAVRPAYRVQFDAAAQ